MNFTHTIIQNTKYSLENSAINIDTINQQLSMHELSYHITQNEQEYAFERLILYSNKYKNLISCINGHIKRKENDLALNKINLIQETTQEILKYAKELTAKLENKK